MTFRYLGPREFSRRVVTFPLRLTPWGARFGLAPRLSDPSASSIRWYRRHAKPVAIVIPTYGDPSLVRDAVRSIRATTKRNLVRVIVSDDGSAPEHVAGLKAIEGIDELVLHQTQSGFAANSNRGLSKVRPDEDAVLLNSDIVAPDPWLEALQHAAYRFREVGIVGPKLLYPDGTIQSAGSLRNPDAPEWWDHRFRGKPEDFGPANVPQPQLAMTGAALYVKRACLDDIGLLDEGYGMAYEDIDWCLRAWEAGWQVTYAPGSVLIHHESKTRGMVQGEREIASQKRFWEQWGPWLDERNVRAEDGGLRIIYVTESVGVGGGHRVVFDHLNGLAARGHTCELWTVGKEKLDWYDLQVPVRYFKKYDELAKALAPVEAIKVATWWNTAATVWLSSVTRGIPVFFVQDIETSYYATDLGVHDEIFAAYRLEFRFLTTSSWVERGLLQWVRETSVISPGVDTGQFRELGRERAADVVMAVGRTNPLKNFPLTRDAYARLPEPRPELVLFGIEPEVTEGMTGRVRYVEKPSDDELVDLMNTSTVFLQTSKHEGFCLPVLEAMACGTPVVCTDANGNTDFCVDGENCLMPAATPAAVAAAVARVLADDALRERLVEGGRRTAQAYAWPAKLDELDEFFRSLAAGAPATPTSGASA